MAVCIGRLYVKTGQCGCAARRWDPGDHVRRVYEERWCVRGAPVRAERPELLADLGHGLYCGFYAETVATVSKANLRLRQLQLSQKPIAFFCA